MAYGSSKTGVTIFLDFRLLIPASEDRSGMGDECLGRGVRISLTFRHKLSRTSCWPLIALTISARVGSGSSPFGVEISGTWSFLDPSSIDIDISQRIDCCNRSTSLANSPAGPKSPLRHVRLSIILIANKVANTTGNENSGPFIQPLVWVQVGMYSWGCMFLQVQVGKYSCIFLQRRLTVRVRTTLLHILSCAHNTMASSKKAEPPFPWSARRMM